MCFGRAFHLILMHLFCYIQCFEVRFKKKSGFFSQKLFFLEFLLIQSNFSINRNLALKIMWASAWFDWSNLFFDQSNIVFQVKKKKNSYLAVSNIFFKSFSTFFLSLSDLARLHSNFLSFSSSILARFFFSRPVRPFYPSFWFYFHVFMHLKGIFGPP